MKKIINVVLVVVILITGTYLLANNTLNGKYALQEFKETYAGNSNMTNQRFLEINRDEYTEVLDPMMLPKTSGSPGQKGDYGIVEFEIKPTTNQVTFYIAYFNAKVKYTTPGILDVSFLSNVKQSLYYTIPTILGHPVIYLSYGYETMLTEIETTNKWTGLALWNLETNKIEEINKAKTVMYLKIENDWDVFSYLTLPDLLVDNVLRVDFQFDYQFTYSWPKSWFVKDKIETEFVIAEYEKRIQNIENPSENIFIKLFQNKKYYEKVRKNTLSEENIYYEFLDAGFINPATYTKEYLDQLMALFSLEPALREYSAPTSLVSEMNQSFKNIKDDQGNDAPVIINNDSKIFRINAGTFGASWANGLKIHQETGKTTYVSYVTNGEVFELEEPYINSIFVVAPKDRYVKVIDLNQEAIITAVVFFILFNFGYLLFASKNKWKVLNIPFLILSVVFSFLIFFGIKLLGSSWKVIPISLGGILIFILVVTAIAAIVKRPNKKEGSK